MSFLEVVQRAAKAYEEGLDASSYEEAFDEVLDYIETHPDHHPSIKAEIREMVISCAKGGYLEVIEYCMYRLRWSEVRDEIQRQIGGKGDERDVALRRLLSSFSDEWEMRDLYKRFAGRQAWRIEDLGSKEKNDVVTAIAAIRRRPLLFLQAENVRDLDAFLTGLCFGLDASRPSEFPHCELLISFRHWVAVRLHDAKHNELDAMLLKEGKSEKEAFQLFFRLWDEYAAMHLKDR